MQNGEERDYLILKKDELYDENQFDLESRFTADDIVLKIEENGIAVSTIWDGRIQDPERIGKISFIRILLPVRSADPAVIGELKIAHLDTDVRATSRVVNIISDEADDVSGDRLRQVSQRYYNFFPDDRDFLIIQKPPNVDASVGGYFSLVGEREKGLGEDAFRDPALFGSAGRLKGLFSL